jgi:hypothetical protein
MESKKLFKVVFNQNVYWIKAEIVSFDKNENRLEFIDREKIENSNEFNPYFINDKLIASFPLNKSEIVEISDLKITNFEKEK